jgi:hypothetical protein
MLLPPPIPLDVPPIPLDVATSALDDASVEEPPLPPDPEDEDTLVDPAADAVVPAFCPLEQAATSARRSNV